MLLSYIEKNLVTSYKTFLYKKVFFLWSTKKHCLKEIKTWSNCLIKIKKNYILLKIMELKIIENDNSINITSKVVHRKSKWKFDKSYPCFTRNIIDFLKSF